MKAVVCDELEHVKQWKWERGEKAFQFAAAEKKTMDHAGYRALHAFCDVKRSRFIARCRFDRYGQLTMMVGNQEHG